MRVPAGSPGSRASAGLAGAMASQTATLDRGVAVMNEPETGEALEAAHSRSDLQKELAEVLWQRAAAISEVLRAIANSPHDLQPIFDTILDSAVHLCRSEGGNCRLAEETGFRLVVSKRSPAVPATYPPPPELLEYGSFLADVPPFDHGFLRRNKPMADFRAKL